MLSAKQFSNSPVAAAISLAIFLGVAMPAAEAQCIVGTNAAMTFDGADDILNVPDQASLSGMAQLTIEAWFKCNPNGGATQALISKSKSIGGVGGQRSYAMQVSAIGQINFFLYNSANQTLTFTSASPTSLADGSWHHAAARVGNGTWAIFVDGTQSNAGSLTLAVNSSTLPLRLGSSLSSDGVTPNNFLNGSIEEVRIWNVARTQSEIQSTMNVGVNGVEPGLVGYWRFDEGSGQTVFNSAVATGSALDGTLGANALPGTDDPTWLPSSAPLLYCPGCGPGSSNSAAASLQINGLGAVGVPGPFAITGASGSTLSLLWTGPPNQPLILAAGPPSAGCGFLPGFGTIDIGTPPSYFDVVFAFNGLVAPTSYFFITNPAGLSAQTFLLPVLPGASLAVQGLVFQPPGVAAFGVLPTASFSIQF
jgi:hypothetical protein